MWLHDLQVIDFSEDGFFAMMTDDGATRDDLKLTENCSLSSADAIRELLSNAEAAGERVVVCWSFFFCFFALRIRFKFYDCKLNLAKQTPLLQQTATDGKLSHVQNKPVSVML